MKEVTLESQLFDIIKDEKMPEHIKLAKIDMLIKLGLDVNAKSRGKSALIWAKENKNDKVIEFLSLNGAKEERISKEEIVRLSKLLHSSFPNIQKMEKLVEQGADINYRDDEVYFTLFMRSTLEKNAEVLDFLLSNGLDINAKHDDGCTELARRSANNDVEVVKMLIEKGADLNIRDSKGLTALMWASFNGNINVVELLIDSGANINDLSDIGCNALGYAVKCGNKKVVEYLIEKGGDASVKDCKGYKMTTFTEDEEIKKIINNAIKEKNKTTINSSFLDKIKQNFRR